MAKEATPLVEPIESITDKKAPKKPETPGIKCWNCEGTLNKKEVCPDCGFDRKLVYNLDLEAQKTKERIQNETNA